METRARLVTSWASDPRVHVVVGGETLLRDPQRKDFKKFNYNLKNTDVMFILVCELSHLMCLLITRKILECSEQK
jgi:hypothetical protein